MPIVLRPLVERFSLPTRLAEIGRARKSARVLGGAFLLISVVLTQIVICSVFDSTLGLSTITRAVLLSSTLVLSGVLFIRWIWCPVKESVRPSAVAQLLESSCPKFNDSLASAIDFLTDNDSERTSPRFQRIAVVRAQRALEKYDTTQLLPSGRAWRSFWCAALTVAVVSGLSIWKPTHASTSLVRLADPFGGHQWPNKTRILLTKPTKFPLRASLGEPFQLDFIVQGVIPEQVSVLVKLENGNRYEEIIEIEQIESNRNSVEVSVLLEPHRIPTSFDFQVRANDDETQWLSIVLAPPPRLVPFEGRPSPQLHATYPAYTDILESRLPDGSGVLEAVHGTRVRMTAATDRPVVAAVLIPQADRTHLKLAASVAPLATQNPLAAAVSQPVADLAHSDIPVTISNGNELSVDFIPRVSGPYLLKFTDETGLSGSRLLDFRVLSDPSPVVNLARPAVGRDPLFLLPTASATFQAAATDRLFALKGLAIEYRFGGMSSQKKEIPLVNFDGFCDPLGAVAGPPIAAFQEKQLSVEATVTLPISNFVKPDGTLPVDGDRILLQAIATDFDDVSVLKDAGRSREEVTIVVVSRPALDTILQQELASLRPKLLQLREQQRRVRERTESVQKMAVEGKMTAEEAAKLVGAERDQRGVRTDVTDPSNGLQLNVDLLRQTIRANSVPRSTTTERVESLAKDLTRLTERDLDPIEPLIASAKQEADAESPDMVKVGDTLRKAVGRQKAAETNLDSMLKLLDQWGGAGEVKAEARALKEQLGKAGDRAKEVSEKVDPGKRTDALTPDQRSELNKTADQFNQLSNRADAIIQKAQRLASEKQSKAADLLARASAKDDEAKAARAEANSHSPGTLDQSSASIEADRLAQEAAELRAEADKAQTESESLRNAVRDAGNQGLKEDLQTAGERLRQNNPSASMQAQRSADERLDAIADALSEQQPDPLEQLKRKSRLADEVFQLERQQDELRKKIRATDKLEDTVKREEELRKLSSQQELIKQQAEILLERLTRQREDEAAEKLRESVEAMQQAQDQLERGQAPNTLEEQALERLKDSVDKLDAEQQKEEQQLDRERQREVAGQLRALRDRLQAVDDEAERIQVKVLNDQEWSRSLQRSVRDLHETTTTIGDDLARFTEKELEPFHVFKRLADQAARLTSEAAERFDERLGLVMDAAGEPFDPVVEQVADDRTRRPLKTALRRLTHIVDALNDGDATTAESQTRMPNESQGGGGQGGGEDGGGSTGKQPGGIPAIAQLKALRGMQAELNSLTSEFHKEHPDKMKLSDADREELEQLERTQREVAELFEMVKEEFEKMKSQQGGIQP